MFKTERQRRIERGLEASGRFASGEFREAIRKSVEAKRDIERGRDSDCNGATQPLKRFTFEQPRAERKRIVLTSGLVAFLIGLTIAVLASTQLFELAGLFAGIGGF